MKREKMAFEKHLVFKNQMEHFYLIKFWQKSIGILKVKSKGPPTNIKNFKVGFSITQLLNVVLNDLANIII